MPSFLQQQGSTGLPSLGSSIRCSTNSETVQARITRNAHKKALVNTLNSSKPNISTYNMLLSAYIECGHWEDGEHLFCQILQHEQISSKLVTMSFNMLTSAYGKAGKFKSMERLLMFFLCEGGMPNTRTYNSIISCYGKSSRLPDMESALSRMLELGLHPNTVTWTSLADAYRKANRHEGLDAVLELLLQNPRELDMKSYGLLIDVYSKRKDRVKLEQTCIQMAEAGLKPDIVTWTSVVDSLQDYDDIVAFSSRVFQVNVKPDVPFYLVLLGSYKHSSCLTKLCEVFSLLKKLDPTKEQLLKAYNIVLDAYGSKKLISRMETALDNLKEDGLKPNVVTYTALISAYARAKMMNKMEVTYICMKVDCLVPDIFVYNVLMDGYASLGMVEMAEETLLEMSGAGFKPSIREYTSVLNAYKNAARYVELVARFSSLHENGLLQSSFQTMAVFFSALKDSRSGNVREHILECARLCDDSHIVSRLLFAERDDTELWEGVKELLSRARRSSLEEAEVLCDSLVEVLELHGLKRRAFRLMEMTIKMEIFVIEKRQENRLVVDLHGLSSTVAEVGLVVWLSNVKKAYQGYYDGNHGYDDGYGLVSIVTGWGRGSRECGESPLRRNVFGILWKLGSPFEVEKENVGRVSARMCEFKDWILQAHVH